MAVAFRQITNAASGSASTLTATFGSAVAAGSIIFAVAECSSAGSTISITGGTGAGTYTDSGQGTVTGGSGLTRFGMFLAPSTSTTSVTATFGAAVPCSLAIYEVTGLTNPVFDKIVSATGTGTAASSGSTGTLSSSAEAAFGFGWSAANFTGPGTGWSVGQGSVTTGNSGDGGLAAGLCEHQAVTANTALTATATVATSVAWIFFCATIMSAIAPIGRLVSVNQAQQRAANW